ncbi:MAG: bifunctional 5,10-methylenetetrahydrofolate dehydrogenase/5,10-methenyltetrahydrofolate cyclohydrolase [Candidatus Cloacimonetes bacterium]|nr:bifunctional 5,10-methylenetetrahydrofolate dehydrogenase/5,10-methenyltetrahydrofolate cyclohydrolase [Candidatus Cloacimonadota bacterium]
MTIKLTGKPVTKEIYSQIRVEIEENNLTPKLVIIIIGEDPASKYYIQNLEKKGSKVGIAVETKSYQVSITQNDILKEIENLNNDPTVHGIMIQKPLPSQLNESEIVMKISPDKDMDGFHPLNVGNLVLDRKGFLPSTPAAVLEMLKFYNIETSGKNIVIIGRSNIVGKPLANLLLRKSKTGNATVTVCHSKTQDLSKVCKKADILIAAIGRAFFVKPEMIKNNAIVIDVGVNRIGDPEKGYRYVGDVDYEACFDKVLSITPVPGGVGTVTTAMLLNNVLVAARKVI